MSGVVSTKLRFKGDKPKKKKRSHREREGDDLDALAREDPSGWVFPTDALEITGPTYLLLPTEPLTCLAWDATRQRVIAAPIELPEVSEGANELSPNELLTTTEPSDIAHVWVVSRLAGSDEVSLRTSAGTFLTASPSGTLSASAQSRGPLEGFTFELTPGDLFPSVALKSNSGQYLSVAGTRDEILSKRAELRADASSPGDAEKIRVKCQRDAVLRVRVAAAEGKEGGGGKRRLLDRAGPSVGSAADELKRNSEAQAWGGGRHHVSSDDRRALRKAAKEGRIAEAMLDRRAAMKSDKYTK